MKASYKGCDERRRRLKEEAGKLVVEVIEGLSNIPTIFLGILHGLTKPAELVKKDETKGGARWIDRKY